MNEAPGTNPASAESIITEAAHTARSKQTVDKSGCTLKTDKCTIRFGGLIAVNTLDMAVQEGEIYGLIGPNGAGKTTIFNLLTGVYEPTDGEIYFQGKRIDGLPHTRPSDTGRRRLSHPALRSRRARAEGFLPRAFEHLRP